MRIARVQLYVGEPLGRFGLLQGHPVGADRQQAFWAEAQRLGLDARAVVCAPAQATRERLARFHTPACVERVAQRSARGPGQPLAIAHGHMSRSPRDAELRGEP